MSQYDNMLILAIGLTVGLVVGLLISIYVLKFIRDFSERDRRKIKKHKNPNPRIKEIKEEKTEEKPIKEKKVDEAKATRPEKTEKPKKEKFHFFKKKGGALTRRLAEQDDVFVDMLYDNKEDIKNHISTARKKEDHSYHYLKRKLAGAGVTEE